jgi:hypothetical protein
MERLERRWQQRSAGAPQDLVPVRVSEQVTVMADPARLWQLVWDPATSPLVMDHVVSAFTVPGTPVRQVGEMQINIVTGPDGTLIGLIHEVVELGPGYRAVTRTRSVTPQATSTTVVLPLDQGGCVLRFRTEFAVPSRRVNAVRAEQQELARRYLSRVKELAETPPRPPAP